MKSDSSAASPQVGHARPDEVLRSFMAAYRLSTARLEACFARAGAPSLIESVVLTQLHNAPEGKLPLQRLGRGLPYVTKGGVTRLMDRMQRNGLVERQDSTADRRVTFAVITERGRAALRHAAAVFREAYSLVFAEALSAEELDQLAFLLDRLRVANQEGARGEAADDSGPRDLFPDDFEDDLPTPDVWRQELEQLLLSESVGA